jgi:hypothetical protein
MYVFWKSVSFISVCGAMCLLLFWLFDVDFSLSLYAVEVPEREERG